MGTRGFGKKEKELIGSVTAEVLDTCRYPVFSIPEDAPLRTISDVRNIAFICNLDQDDILAITIADGLSGTYVNAVGAKNSINNNERIHVVNKNYKHIVFTKNAIDKMYVYIDKLEDSIKLKTIDDLLK